MEKIYFPIKYIGTNHFKNLFVILYITFYIRGYDDGYIWFSHIPGYKYLFCKKLVRLYQTKYKDEYKLGNCDCKYKIKKLRRPHYRYLDDITFCVKTNMYTEIPVKLYYTEDIQIQIDNHIEMTKINFKKIYEDKPSYRDNRYIDAKSLPNWSKDTHIQYPKLIQNIIKHVLICLRKKVVKPVIIHILKMVISNNFLIVNR